MRKYPDLRKTGIRQKNQERLQHLKKDIGDKKMIEYKRRQKSMLSQRLTLMLDGQHQEQ